MVQPAQARNGHYGRVRGRLGLNRPPIRRILFQGIVSAVLMVIAHVITDKPAQMFFVQRNDMVEELAATTPYPEWSRNSCGPPVVILEKTAEALPAVDRCHPAPRQFLGTRE